MKAPGSGIESTPLDTNPSSSTFTFSEIALYLTIFFPAVHYGGVRLHTVLLLQSILLLSFFLDRVVGTASNLKRINTPSFFLSLFLFSFWLFVRCIDLDFIYRGIAAYEVYITAVFVFLLTCALSDSRVRRKRTILIILGASFLIALPHLIISYRQSDPRSENIYFLFHGHHYHGFVILVIGIGLGIQMFIRKFGAGIVLFLLNAVLMMSLLYYRKAGGVIAFFVMISVFFYLLGTKRGFLRKMLPIIIVLLVLMNFLIIIGMDTIIHELSISTSLTDGAVSKRFLSIYQGTLEMIKEHLFLGVGLGKFSYSFPEYRNPYIDATPRFAHSEPLQLVAETGLIGLLLCLFLIATYIRALQFPELPTKRPRSKERKIHRKHVPFSSHLDQAFSVGARAGLIAFGVICITDFELHIPANAFLFAYIAGELLLLESNKTEGEISPHARYMLQLPRFLSKPVTLVILLCIVFSHNTCLMLSSIWFRDGTALRISDEKKAIEVFTDSIVLYPLNPEPYFSRGQIYLSWGTDWVSKAGEDFERALYSPGKMVTIISIEDSAPIIKGNMRKLFAIIRRLMILTQTM